MNKINYSKLAKMTGLTATAVLLLGAGGCSYNSTTTPATVTPTPTVATSTEVSPTVQAGNVVTLTTSGFSPASITIKSGQSVTFVNNSSALARVASDPHPIHNGLAGFDDLKGSNTGESYSFTFTKTGTFGYHNHLSPSTKGTVIVTP